MKLLTISNVNTSKPKDTYECIKNLKSKFVVPNLSKNDKNFNYYAKYMLKHKRTNPQLYSAIMNWD